MLALILAVTTLIGPAGPIDQTAVQWRVEGEADEPSAVLRERLREEIAARDGRPASAVRDRAVARARLAVAHELPVSARVRHRALREALDGADLAYREGRFDDAMASLEQVLDQLHADPGVPGAAASAREAHLLTAKLAWAGGDRARAEQALVDALRIDPYARLSAREASPELVERHDALAAACLAGAGAGAGRDSEWIEPQISWLAGQSEDAATLIEIEIDGVPGLRPVPAGPHFIVVRRPGYEPLASWRDVDGSWELPEGTERIPRDPRRSVEAVCETLALDLLVLAERRAGQIGLQARRCGAGFGSPWFGPPERLEEGVAEIFAGPFTAAEDSLAGQWPSPLGDPSPDSSEPAPTPARPWFRRGWIWGTSAGVVLGVAGGVVAGVLLGAREQPLPAVKIDADQFIGGDL